MSKIVKPQNNLSLTLAKRQLVDSIWKSAGIEGLGTTFPNTEDILNNVPVMARAEEVLFIVNMKRAWVFLFENLSYPDNLSFLREFNKICMVDLAYNAGTLRTIPVSIGGTDWKPELPQEGIVIADLERIIQMENKLASALEMFCYIARTQMFIDGNKRVAQLMCNKIMIRHDLGIFSIPYGQIPTFRDQLVNFYETGSAKNIKLFFVENCLLLNTENPATNRYVEELLQVLEVQENTEDYRR